MSRLKIAIIGAGSVGFTRKLVTDLLCVPELRDIDIALTDIDERNLGMVRQILDTIVDVNGLPTRIESTLERRRALEGARYVINCARVGGLSAFSDDIRIPIQYGVRWRHPLWSAIDPCGARFLPRHPRGLRSRCAIA
jgi:alpha-galactosidase